MKGSWNTTQKQHLVQSSSFISCYIAYNVCWLLSSLWLFQLNNYLSLTVLTLSPKWRWKFVNMNITEQEIWCLSVCFFSTRGRVWVHHLNLCSDHCQNSDGKWFSFRGHWRNGNGQCFFLPLICIHLHIYVNKKKLGQPPLERQCVVSWTHAQVVNSNSTLVVRIHLSVSIEF